MLVKDHGVEVEKIWGKEVWFFSSRDEHESIVETERGKERFKDWLKTAELTEFPILIKILDSKEPTSIQVHPPKEEGGKDEVWVVLSDVGWVYLCGNPITSDDVMEFMEKLQVKRYDVINIPSNTVHGLGEHTRVLEVSTNSDITYRLYDFGRGRELNKEYLKNVVHRPLGEILRPPITHQDFENEFVKITYINETDASLDEDLVIVFPLSETQINGERIRENTGVLVYKEKVLLSGECITIIPKEVL